MEKINHSQIARAAGVSRPTVSRALQNHPSLPKSTRLRIQALANEMGYRPNPMVSALMASRNQSHPSSATTTMAVLTTWRPTLELAPVPTFKRLLKGAQLRAEQLGYQLEEFWLDEPGVSHARLSSILASRGIVAVLVAPVPPEHQAIHLNWELFSAAAFAHFNLIPDLHCAAHFHFRSYTLAIAELAGRGYRRPGLVLTSATPKHVVSQWIGAHHAATAAFPSRVAPFVFSSITARDFIAWCKSHKPDIVLSNDHRIPKWLNEARKSLPSWIGFASLDRDPANKELGGIDQLNDEIGCAAVDLVVSQINCNERGIPRHAKNVLIEGRWVDGPSSTRPASIGKKRRK